MLTDLVRDALFTAGWFGLMSVVWFGWAQEDPPPAWRARLGAGSVVGLLLAVGGGLLVARRWDAPTALADVYPWFGVLVGLEVLAAGGGAWVLHRRGQSRWTAWWVGLVVALHLVPLAILLEDASLAVLGALLTAGLLVLRGRLRTTDRTTSAASGALLGAGLQAGAVVAAANALLRGL